MIKDITTLLFEYKDYGNIYNKIKLEEKNKNLIKLKRGLYETDCNANKFMIGNVLYSPSYISFETALAYYGMIPERVYVTKSATYMKNRTKEYNNYFGTFLYQDINKNAYPYEIDVLEIENQNVLIASREKALLDMISVVSPRRNIKEIVDLLFEDLRIDDMIFDELDKAKMIELCDLYQSKSLHIFKKYLKKELLREQFII